MAEQLTTGHLRSVIHFLQGIASTLLCFALLLTIYLLTIYHLRLPPVMNYAIVFDAGSSHTEMFVYRWAADKSKGLGTTSSVDQYFVCLLNSINIPDPTKPGEIIKLKAISDFEHHLELLESYFRPCLNEAIEKIPSDRQKYSPIFLGATAGMRLARLRNFAQAQNVLETIREIFANTPFQFVVARQVRILSGMEEAIDGWITTNLLLEKFRHRHTKPKAANQFDSDMVGVLDLGGASTQVTFTYQHQAGDEPIPKDFTTNITLFNTVYRPYAHSYLCWGKDEGIKRYRARLVNSEMKSPHKYTLNATYLQIRDPCLANGIEDAISVSTIFRSPCTINEKEKFNTNLNVSAVIFVGNGNATQCEQRLKNLFNAKRNHKTVNCTYKKEYCTFDHAFQPKLPTNLEFIGLSGYYYVFNNLAYRMNKTEGKLSERYRFEDFRQVIAERLSEVCETPYSDLYVQEGMTPKSEKYKRNLCFDAWYMWLLLTYGIGFKENELERLSFANTFPTGKVGWALGYMINQTNYIPAEYRERLLTKRSFIGWLTGSLVILLLTLSFLLVTCSIFWRRFRSTTDNRKIVDYAQPNEQAVV